jgi:hypothetical protein
MMKTPKSVADAPAQRFFAVEMELGFPASAKPGLSAIRETTSANRSFRDAKI